MNITSSLFEAFLKCPTKIYLRSLGETGSGNDYADWVRAQDDSYEREAIRRFTEAVPEAERFVSPPTGEVFKTAKWRLAMNVVAQTPDRSADSHVGEFQTDEATREVGNAEPQLGSSGRESAPSASQESQSRLTSAATNLESRLHAIERIPSSGRGKAAQFIPIRFIWRNKLTKDDKLLLAFDALVLSESLGRGVHAGKIIHGDDYATLKVKLGARTAESARTRGKTTGLLGEARKRIADIATLLSGGNSARGAESRSADSPVRESQSHEETRGLGGPRSGPTPPDLVLNRHCAECEFRDRCRKIAIEKDDLSLLAGMSAKERQQLRSKGIFTVTQLSYTFRPRRRPKRLRDKREKYHHALKALAIREKKIHIVGSPELKIEGTPVYLDVEGLPDRDFYYLIGLRIGDGESAVQHSLWADTVADESKIWREFLGILETVERPVLIHYGSYETTFLKRMCDLHGGPPESLIAAGSICSSVNLVSVLFAQIYFPTHSNSLKDTAGWLGYKWSASDATGTQSIVWRHRWEASSQASAKGELVTYNAQDCEALEILTTMVQRLKQSDAEWADEGNRQSAVVAVDSLSEQPWLFQKFASPIAELEMINKAARWNYQRNRIYVRTDEEVKRANKAVKVRKKRADHMNSRVRCARSPACPRCRKKASKYSRQQTKTLYDLRFTRFGVKRWVVEYQFGCYWCRICCRSFGTPAEFWKQGKYGRNLIAFVVFQVIELCIAQHTVGECINRLFRLGLGQCAINNFKVSAARHYDDTRQRIMAEMVKGKMIHADETRILLKGKPAYIWVFATFREVAYFYSETREGELPANLLKEFKGVLVSDFYAAYDSLSCAQQKCLIHLMRDLNDAVLDHPFNEEVRGIVTQFGELLRGIVATIDQRGLKRHFLRKHGLEVERFYRQMRRTTYQSEAALKCKERFEKNREKLFTFLNHDGVPWNNNNVEHAIKAFARLRRAIEGLSTPKGIEEYLILLSVCQTCKYMGVDFLDFLRSGEKDIHAFAESRRGRRRRTQTSQPIPSPTEIVPAEGTNG